MPGISSIAVNALWRGPPDVGRCADRESAPGACPWNVAEFMSLFFQCSG
jgi:hypothetical protein